MKYIHYGSKKYDPELFIKIVNTELPQAKPIPGCGLWASPVDSKFGWVDWCKVEEFREYEPGNSFCFELSKKAKIITINTLEDLKKLPRAKVQIPGMGMFFGIDFEKLSKDYDAIFLTEDGQWETRLSHPENLYGWDCECILVLRTDNIISDKIKKYEYLDKTDKYEK